MRISVSIGNMKTTVEEHTRFCYVAFKSRQFNVTVVQLFICSNPSEWHPRFNIQYIQYMLLVFINTTWYLN
jgi:hypothetical protein